MLLSSALAVTLSLTLLVMVVEVVASLTVLLELVKVVGRGMEQISSSTPQLVVGHQAGVHGRRHGGRPRTCPAFPTLLLGSIGRGARSASQAQLIRTRVIYIIPHVSCSLTWSSSSSLFPRVEGLPQTPGQTLVLAARGSRG